MRIRFIGLGNMGYGMALNLLKAGHEVAVYDVEKEKVDTLIKEGAKENGDANIAILCLPHPDISREVILNMLQNSPQIKTIIDTSTLTPQVSQDFYELAHEKNVEFLCAPMLGGKTAAMNKKIHFLVEGDKEVFDTHKSIFLDMGMRADYMGEIPNATLAKLAYNICRYSNIATAAEVARFLHAHTKTPEPIYNLLVEGSLDNFGQVWKEDMTNMVLKGITYEPSNVPEKDFQLIEGLVEKKKLSTSFFRAVRDVYILLKKQRNNTS